MGTSGVERLALLLETTGHSALAYASSRALISALGISTAQNTKSAIDATVSTWEASCTTICSRVAGSGVFIDQRPPRASLYVLPAERGLAARTVTSNQGCSARRVAKRCPTMPVQPMIPTRNFFMGKTPFRLSADTFTPAGWTSCRVKNRPGYEKNRLKTGCHGLIIDALTPTEGRPLRRRIALHHKA